MTSFLDGRQHSQTVVYVEVAYTTLDTSPRIATGTQHWFLKNTILEFKVDSAGGLVTEVATVPKADCLLDETVSAKRNSILARILSNCIISSAES